MPSPFPGMDPYIESSGYWSEFHTSMVVAIRDELNARLPPGFAATVDVYVWLESSEPGRSEQLREPDVYVTEEPGRPRGTAAAAVADPETIVLPRTGTRRRRYVKIEDLSANRVVTVIELLSPSNKELGADRQRYLAKRDEYLANRLSLVEIDLLRGGRRLPLSDPQPRVVDYYIMVCRAWQYPQAGFYRFSMRDPLPDLRVPVVESLSDVVLSLRACMDRVYDGARYAAKLRYSEPLTPRPRKQDVAWLAGVVAGHRPQ